MSNKSRHGKGKHSSRRKRSQEKHHHSTVAVQQRAVAEVPEPVSRRREPSPLAKLTAAHYPHIAAELWTIGILAGLMLIILVVLALVL